MKELLQQWCDVSQKAFEAGARGDRDQCMKLYATADYLIDRLPLALHTKHNAISLARHFEVDDVHRGLVQSCPMNEDFILSLTWPDVFEESDTSDGLSVYDPDPRYVRMRMTTANKNDSPHVQVISPGRSGTVSLYKLLADTLYLPYHTFIFNPPRCHNYWMMHSLLSGDWIEPELWYRCRRAEWIGAENVGRNFINLNHLDSVYAPFFASVHKNSKFLYLKRDPVKIFKSFVEKNQFNNAQIWPLYTGLLDSGFRWKERRMDMAEKMAWYIRFHDNLAWRMSEAYGDRVCTISSDLLFDQDETEINRLLDFLGLEISMDGMKKHFSKKINEKAHKAKGTVSTEEFEEHLKCYAKVA